MAFTFTTNDLLLSAEKAAQLTKALSNLGVAAPLQYVCDEAAAEAARLTTGYVIEDNAMRGFVRPLALYRAYGYAGPVPKDVQVQYDAVRAELEAIAQGKRPNLPRVTGTGGTAAPSGKWGAKGYVKGRTDPA